MKNIKRIFLAVVVMMAATSASAQLKTSYFMEGSTYRYDMNPALTPQRGYIKLPGLSLLSLNIDNNLLSINRFLYQKNGQTVTFLHKDVSEREFLSKFHKDNFLGVDVNVPILGFGDYNKHYFWSFDLGVRALGGVTMPRDVFRFVKTLGSDSYEMSNLRADINGYVQASLGFAFPIGDYVMVGVKAKGLLGVAHANANIDNLTLDISEDKVTASAHGYVEAGVAGVDISELKQAGDNFTIKLTDDDGSGSDFSDLTSKVRFDKNTLFKNLNNGGFALDFGAEVNLLDDKLHLSASVVDLGWVWYKNSAMFKTNTLTAEWTGANASNLINGETFDISKELKGNYSEIVFTTQNSNTVVSRLATQLNVGAEYGFLNNKISLGLLSHTKFYESHTYSELTASLNLRGGNWFSTSFSYSLLNNNYSSLGFALNFHPKGFNFFIGTDYIPLLYAKTPRIGSDEGFAITKLPVDNFGLSLYAGISFSLHEARFGIESKSKESKESRKAAKAAKKARK